MEGTLGHIQYEDYGAPALARLILSAFADAGLTIARKKEPK